MVDAPKVALLCAVLFAYPVAVAADAGAPSDGGRTDYDAGGDEDDGNDRRRRSRLGADAASHEASCSIAPPSARERLSAALFGLAGVMVLVRARRRVT